MKVRRPSSRRPSRGRASGVCRRSTPFQLCGASARGHALCWRSARAPRRPPAVCVPAGQRRAGHAGDSALPRPQEHHPPRATQTWRPIGSKRSGATEDRSARPLEPLRRRLGLECLDCDDVVSRKRPRSRSSILAPPRRSGFLPCRLISGVSARHSCGNGFIAPLQHFGIDIGDPRGPDNCLRSRRIAPAQSLHSAPSL